MSPEDDIVRMYDGDYEVEADKRKSTYPTALHVHNRVHQSYAEIEHRGGDLMLMLSCHGSRKRTSLVENNSSYVETVALAEKTILTGMLLWFNNFNSLFVVIVCKIKV
jgi:hypothetical protein